MLVMRDETFGPVLAVMKVDSMDQAVELANDSNLGLTGSVWSRDSRRADELARRIQAGAITINDHLMSHGMAETPWGGFKESSIGRTHGDIGFAEMTEPQVIVHDVLPEFGVRTVKWEPDMSEGDLDAILETELDGRRLGAILMETPANPTNDLFSISMARRIADRHSNGERRVPVAVDNTFLGPLWQHPLKHGADLVVYSATKYIGGHSDLIAGAVLGCNEMMSPVARMRTVLGSMATPLTSWLMMRSLETLDLRMRRETESAQKIAAFLVAHPKVVDVGYLGLLEEGDPGYEIYKEQAEGPGAMITFWIDGDEEEAFRFIDSLSLIHLAVSLGSTETLVEHPATMTHAGLDPDEKKKLRVNGALMRLSMGVENPDDLIHDISTALDAV